MPANQNLANMGWRRSVQVLIAAFDAHPTAMIFGIALGLRLATVVSSARLSPSRGAEP